MEIRTTIATSILAMRTAIVAGSEDPGLSCGTGHDGNHRALHGAHGKIVVVVVVIVAARIIPVVATGAMKAVAGITRAEGPAVFGGVSLLLAVTFAARLFLQPATLLQPMTVAGILAGGGADHPPGTADS